MGDLDRQPAEIAEVQRVIGRRDLLADRAIGQAYLAAICAARIEIIAVAVDQAVGMRRDDLDMLASINREMGRKAGDKALQAVAEVFTDTLRMPDHAGRYGDEEGLSFMVASARNRGAHIECGELATAPRIALA